MGTSERETNLCAMHGVAVAARCRYPQALRSTGGWHLSKKGEHDGAHYRSVHRERDRLAAHGQPDVLVNGGLVSLILATGRGGFCHPCPVS